MADIHPLSINPELSEKKSRARKRRKQITTLAKIGVSLFLLAVVYSTVDFKQLLKTLSAISAPTAAIIVGMYIFGQILSSLKWRIFLTNAGIKRSFSETLRAYFFGMFVNTFGVGTVGGDLTRSLAIGPAKGERAASLATVVADRVHGLTILISIGAIAVFIVRPPILGAYAPVLAILIVIGLITGWFIGPKILTLIFHKDHRFGGAALQAANAFPSEIKPLLQATAISFAFHCTQILMHIIIARELMTGLSNSYLFATIPWVNAASALPISTNGLGVREYMYILLLTPAGVTHETAVAFGAIWIVTVSLVSAICGPLAMPPAADKLIGAEAEEIEEELEEESSAAADIETNRTTKEHRG